MGAVQDEEGEASRSLPAVNQTTMDDTRSREDAEGRPTLEAARAPSIAEPMDGTSLNNSNVSAAPADPATESSASAPATMPVDAIPYGTRSRNRPGTSRINYAEDTEMDFELYTAPSNGAQDKSTTSGDRTSRSPLDGDTRKSPSVGTKAAKAINGGWTSMNKDSAIPGTSTFSANPNVTVPQANPKKRKAAVSSTLANGNHHQILTSGHTSSRRLDSLAGHRHHPDRETNMYFFEKSKAMLKNGTLEADDGTVFSVNDYVYLVCEPPGEPYYLGRVMEYRHVESDNPRSPVDGVRINWVYRPRDIQRFSHDSRLVYGTMHSDFCPITSLRGKCQILHRSKIGDLDEYRKLKDSFWWNQVWDRFIHRSYEAIPTSQVINVPEKVKKALDERWKYIVVETSRVKELTSAVKLCQRCSSYSAPNDSVDCAVCRNTYHMNCVDPPLAKKPTRGFAWACGPCSRAQEKKLEARRTPLIGDLSADADEDELMDEEEDEAGAVVNTTAPSPTGSAEMETAHPPTQAEIEQAKLWPMRYLGIHCRLEDVLRYDDPAIYPRASSRLGTRHQANVDPWYGHAVELVKPIEIKKKYLGAKGKKDNKLSKETIAAIEAEKVARANRPKWVQDEPKGYVRRGEDLPNKDSNNTAKLLFRMPDARDLPSRGDDDPISMPDAAIDAYMERAKALAKDFGVKDYNTDFLTRAVTLYTECGHNADEAIKKLKKTDPKKDLRDPTQILTADEKKRFEEGVAKYGSELRSVRLHMKSNVSHGDIVRYWYMWKKKRGKEIWGTFGGRRSTKKRVEADVTSKLLDDVADDQDDSAFDSNKAIERKRGFQCKFCSARKSRQWRRAPGVAPGATVPGEGKGKDKSPPLVLALCQRCANLWRKYAIRWEEHEEIAKKVAQGGGKAWKRRIDEELVREWKLAQEAAASGSGAETDMSFTTVHTAQEPPKKKVKSGLDSNAPTPPAPKPLKEKPAPPPRPPTPPLIPAQPKFRELPCAVCHTLPPADQVLVCRDCRLTVHRKCYGVDPSRNSSKWYCDMCLNDRKEFASYEYNCILCDVEERTYDLVEPPKVSHKKKTDREREKERQEKELAVTFAEDYRRAQSQRGRPIKPREPLKRTADNNWVHVNCAVWTPEVRFSDATKLERVEYIPQIPKKRIDTLCKFCKSTHGACVSCHQCNASFHIGCAENAGSYLAFDITPVKHTRRDGVNIVTVGAETGAMSAAIWCKEHVGHIKTITHPPWESVDDAGTTAMELFVGNCKQADLTLTGTARKANMLDESTKNFATTGPGNRRISTVTTGGATRIGRNSSAGLPHQDGDNRQCSPQAEATRRHCITCKIEVSPKWWKMDTIMHERDSIRPPVSADSVLTNGIKSEPSRAQDETNQSQMTNGVVEQRAFSDVASAALTANAENGLETYQCNKCHAQKLKAVPEEPKIQESGPQRDTLAANTSPRAPPPAHLQWGIPLPTASQHGHIQGWPAPQPAFTSASMQSPQASAHLPLHPTYPTHGHSAPHPGGYIIGAPPGHGPPPPAVSRSPYPPHSVPPPLHLTHAGLPNGLPSPHMAANSPTHPPMNLSGRQTESPYAGGPSPHLPPFAPPHGSPVAAPVAVSNRPSTPRDTPAVPTPTAENRIGGGASNSPSLRNLIH